MPDWTRANLRPISSGVEQNITTRRESDIRTPSSAPAQQTPAQQPPAAQAPAQQPPPAVPGAAATSETGGPNVQGARLRFDPQTVNLAPGQTATLGVSIDNVTDLYSIPMILQFDPTVITVQDIQHGGFLSSGNQEIAIVKGGDESKGQLMIAATRQPNTPGVSGSGTLLGIVVKALKPGSTQLSIVQVNAKDSQQKPLPLLTGEATIQVK
jgi:general secretion pathway protein D